MLDSALKIGIIRLSSLGDIISTMVFLEFIRTKFASSGRKIEITFIVDTQFRGIVADSAMIDKIIDLPLRASKKNKKLLFEIYRKTRQLGRFDILIDAQGLLKSALIGALIKKKKFVGFSADSAREKMASLFYHKKAKIAYGEHILKRQYELFKCAFEGDSANSQNLVKNQAKTAESSLDSAPKWEDEFCLDFLENRNLNLGFSAQAREKIAQILAPFKANKKILFLCETSKADKEFSLTSFYALAEGLWSDYKDARIFLIWDKKESEIRALGAKDTRFCVLPHLNFDEIKALLASVDLVIGGDTGITHSAWAMRVPSVTIYVSTDIKRFELGGEKHFSLCVGNSSLGASCGDFGNLGRFADSKVQSHTPNSQKTPQPPPQILEFEDLKSADSATRAKIAESNLDSENSQNLVKKSCHSNSLYCHSERSEESKKNPFVILSKAKYLKKKNRDSSVATLPQNDKIGAENDNLSEFAEFSTDSATFSQSGLPRRFCESARNDGLFLDSSLRKCSAQNDKIKGTQNNKIKEIHNDKNSVRVAESTLDSANQNISSLRDSAKQNRGNPHCENIAESQGGLPRRFCESARNDDFITQILRFIKKKVLL